MRARAVTVKQLPERLNVKQGRLFFREIKSFMEVDRPCIVLDCSNLRQVDKSAAHLLICCLEAALKRNGDVKLAELPLGAEATLERDGIYRLFDIYETTADAVNSFHQPPIEAVLETIKPGRARRKSESAA
jgi:anti-anti-sigma regulatory factor